MSAALTKCTITTAQLHAETGVPKRTIHRHAAQLDGLKIGGRAGFVFPKEAPKWLRQILREKMK